MRCTVNKVILVEQSVFFLYRLTTRILASDAQN